MHHVTPELLPDCLCFLTSSSVLHTQNKATGSSGNSYQLRLDLHYMVQVTQKVFVLSGGTGRNRKMKVEAGKGAHELVY